jgi:predicted RNase H-like nuclease (RuvC/YqgF family)
MRAVFDVLDHALRDLESTGLSQLEIVGWGARHLVSYALDTTDRIEQAEVLAAFLAGAVVALNDRDEQRHDN